MQHIVRFCLYFSALAIGVWGWRTFGMLEWYSPLQFSVIALQACIALLPPINRWLTLKLEFLRHPTERTRAITASVIGIAGSTYLYLSAIQQGRDFFPKFHDEYMHLVHAQMLAIGRLWMPSHALPQFFETFHVFVKPVYAPMQFPGTSMLHVPAIWLHLPYWVTPIVIGGATLGLFYRVTAELMDGVAGCLAAILLLGVEEFRYLSLMVLSDPAALLLGLLMVYAWLKWRRTMTFRRAVWVGSIAGWTAITRPPDALCFAIPVGVAMLWALRAANPSGTKFKRIFKCGSALILGAAPFLSLQLIFDHGVTGHWLQTPHEQYVREFHPGINFGLSKVAATPARPQTTLRQKIDFYDGFVVRDVGRYTLATAPKLWIEERLPMVFKASLPSMVLIVLLPFAIFRTPVSKPWVLLWVFPLFFSIYVLSTHFDLQYCIITVVTFIPASIIAARALDDAILKWKPQIIPATTAILCGVAVGRLPQLNPSVTDQYPSRGLEAVEKSMGTIHGHALVFFHYDVGANVHEEPVYNIESARIDSQRIVRAQDLGKEENAKLIRYYAARQSDREVYLFNRVDRSMILLGTVTTLANKPQ